MPLKKLLAIWRTETRVYRASDRASAEVRARHLRGVLRLTPWLMLTNVVNGALLAVVLWPVMFRPALLAWLVLLVAVCAPAMLAWLRHRAAPPLQVSGRAIRHATAHAALLGTAWALPPLLWLGSVPPPQQLVLAVTSAGMLSAGAFVLVSIPAAGLAWVATLGLGGLTSLAVSDEPTFHILAGLYLIYLGVAVMAVVSSARQVNARLESEREAERQSQMVSLLLRDFEENSADVLWEIDRRGQFTHVSAKLLSLLEAGGLGSGEGGLLALLTRYCPGGRASEDLRALRRAMTQDKPFRDVQLTVHMPDGMHWWSVTAKPLVDDLGHTVGWRGVISDVTQQRLAHQRLMHQAHFDSLTGLANREQLRTRLNQALEACATTPRRCALLCMDLDNFKSINDTLGHAVGDGVLRLVAQRLQSVMRRVDLVARLAGDEFAVLLDDVRSEGEVAQLASRLLQVLNAPATVNGRSVQVGVSVGVAYIPDHGGSIDEVLSNADLALYAAKEGGRGRCEVYAPRLGERSRRQVSIEQELRLALARGELSLCFQPIVNAQTWQMNGAEALLRWHHPTLGQISPAEFIPVAEKSGLIGELGSWVLNEACSAAASHMPGLSISINVSPAQLMRGHFVADVERALERSGLAPERVEIELTESIFMDDAAQVLAHMHALKRLGVRMALDDFGTGYSAFQYLRRFPFDTLKIDRAFVRELLAHHDARVIVRTIIGLANALGMRTIAEGVEEPAQLEVLRLSGCSDIQGYLVARPEPLVEFLDQLAHWNEAGRPPPGPMPETDAMPLVG